jgi:hypothetical protein
MDNRTRRYKDQVHPKVFKSFIHVVISHPLEAMSPPNPRNMPDTSREETSSPSLQIGPKRNAQLTKGSVEGGTTTSMTSIPGVITPQQQQLNSQPNAQGYHPSSSPSHTYQSVGGPVKPSPLSQQIPPTPGTQGKLPCYVFI